MRYVNINVEVPVAETPAEVMEMLRDNPKLFRRVQGLSMKIVAQDIIKHHVKDQIGK